MSNFRSYSLDIRKDAIPKSVNSLMVLIQQIYKSCTTFPCALCSGPVLCALALCPVLCAIYQFKIFRKS
jgi:hypothetical protein